MWPDPTDTSKRKPRNLGGTPANRFVFLSCVSSIAVFFSCLISISYTPWFERKLNNLRKQTIELDEKRIGRALTQDPVISRALENKKLEYEDCPRI